MKKLILFTISFMIILTFLGSGCFTEEENGNNQFQYSIKIEVQRPFNYTVYAPIAYNDQSDFLMLQIAIGYSLF